MEDSPQNIRIFCSVHMGCGHFADRRYADNVGHREDVGEDVGVVECGLYAIVCVGETSVLRTYNATRDRSVELSRRAQDTKKAVCSINSPSSSYSIPRLPLCAADRRDDAQSSCTVVLRHVGSVCHCHSLCLCVSVTVFVRL